MSELSESPNTEVPARPCATCKASLALDQDWCLECGSAQPGRLGGRPGWRAALTVLGLTGLLTGGAAAAGYAALSSESQRQASVPAQTAPAPQVAQVPPVTAPPAEETPVVPAPDSGEPDLPDVDVPEDEDEPIAPSGSSGGSTGGSSGGTSGGSSSGGSTGGSSGGSTGGTDTSTETTPSEPVAIDLPASAASTYDPYNRGDTGVGDPADAIDGKAKTAWEAPVGEEGEVRMGLALSLKKATALSGLTFTADTPGFNVEVYGTRATELPPDVLDARWEHITDRDDVGVSEEIDLDAKYRHVVLWITQQPADTKVAISEIQLFD